MVDAEARSSGVVAGAGSVPPMARFSGSPTNRSMSRWLRVAIPP